MKEQLKSKSILISVVAIFAALALAAGLAGCSSSNQPNTNTSSDSSKTIKVGASPSPHAEILNHVKDALSKDGYNLEVVEYNDYIQPNTALESGELDANYFQHITYLNNFNEENNTHLVSAGNIHFEPMRIFAGKSASLDAIPDGGVVTVPNDTTNEARALLLLEQEGLIKLKEGAGTLATVADIVENPKNLQIKEIEAAQVPRSLDDSEIAVINCNYALSAGLELDKSLAVESDSGEAAKAYANVIAVKEGNENTDKTKALVKALQSDDVKEFINSNYKGAVVALF